MTDPERWKDASDAPRSFREALAESREVPPLPEDVRRDVRAAVILAEIALGGTSEKGSGSEKASTLGAKSLAKWKVAAVGAGGLALSLVVALSWKGQPSAPPTGPGVSASAWVPTPLEPSARGELPVAPLAISAEAPQPSASLRVAPSAQRERPPQADDLTEENAILGRARVNLAMRPEVSLKDAEEHARRFPRGALAMERDSMHMSALKRLGRLDEAKTEARRFLASYPTSPYTPAARAILSEGTPR